MLCVSALLLFLALASYSRLIRRLTALQSSPDPRRPQLDRNYRRVSLRHNSAVLGSRLVSSSALHGMLGMRWFRSSDGAKPVGENAGSNLAFNLRTRLARDSSRPCTLDERDPDRGIGRANRRRRFNPLPECCRRLYCLHDGAGNSALPHDRLLILGHQVWAPRVLLSSSR